jgi:hypothetical protein
MIPEISEFSYGFALTNEIVGWTALKAAPVFPSLIEEGKKGGGYDVKLDMPGIPLYLQFKRADGMLRNTARELSQHGLPLALPFYRFPITQAKKSQQHELLLELDDGTNEVYYAAPRFHELDEINQAWSKQTVAAKSIFVRPRDIGSLDAEAHHVSFDRHRAFLCSNPREVEYSSVVQLVGRLAERLAEDKRPLREKLQELNSSLDHAWQRGKDQLLGIASDYSLSVPRSPVATPENESELAASNIAIRQPAPIGEDYRPLRQLADNAAKLFNSQLVVVQPLSSLT